MTLVASALAGGDCIDAADVLRAGWTAGAIGCTVKAPSTLGAFLRSFRRGHVRCKGRTVRQSTQADGSSCWQRQQLVDLPLVAMPVFAAVPARAGLVGSVVLLFVIQQFRFILPLIARRSPWTVSPAIRTGPDPRKHQQCADCIGPIWTSIVSHMEIEMWATAILLLSRHRIRS